MLLKTLGLQDPGVREELCRRLAASGIAADRVTLLPQTKTVAEHLATYQRADIGLDTFPYNGTTTTCEALWMGVPVVTLAGDRHASRVGVSLLNNVGLGDLVAQTPREYVDAAVRLAEDVQRRQSLRETLRQRMRESALMDPPRFARNVEEAYRTMWRRWCGVIA